MDQVQRTGDPGPSDPDMKSKGLESTENIPSSKRRTSELPMAYPGYSQDSQVPIPFIPPIPPSLSHSFTFHALQPLKCPPYPVIRQPPSPLSFPHSLTGVSPSFPPPPPLIRYTDSSFNGRHLEQGSALSCFLGSRSISSHSSFIKYCCNINSHEYLLLLELGGEQAASLKEPSSRSIAHKSRKD